MRRLNFAQLNGSLVIWNLRKMKTITFCLFNKQHNTTTRQMYNCTYEHVPQIAALLQTFHQLSRKKSILISYQCKNGSIVIVIYYTWNSLWWNWTALGTNPLWTASDQNFIVALSMFTTAICHIGYAMGWLQFGRNQIAFVASTTQIQKEFINI